MLLVGITPHLIALVFNIYYTCQLNQDNKAKRNTLIIHECVLVCVVERDRRIIWDNVKLCLYMVLIYCFDIISTSNTETLHSLRYTMIKLDQHISASLFCSSIFSWRKFNEQSKLHPLRRRSVYTGRTTAAETGGAPSSAAEHYHLR